MKITLLTITLALIGWSNFANAQTNNWQWAKSAGGDASITGIDDNSTSIAIDNNGNSYITGNFVDTISFDAIKLTSSGLGGFYVAKYDPSGNVVWAKSSNGNSMGRSIFVNAKGIYITGSYSSSTITFGNITLTNTSSGSNDFFVVKYDTSGTALWANTATPGTASASEIGYGVCADNNGNCYVTGSFQGTTLAFGSTILTNSGSSSTTDMFVAKYSNGGGIQWALRSGQTSNDAGSAIAVAGDGSYCYTTGYITTTTGGVEVSISKYYGSIAAGIWSRQAYGTSNKEDKGTGIGVDENGNSYITGYFLSSSINFGTVILTNPGIFQNFFISKWDGNGNVIWAKKASGGSNNEGRSICTDINGNSYILGDFTSGSFTIDTVTLTNSGIFLAKYDSLGTMHWTKGVAGGSYVKPNGIGIDANISFGNNTLINADNGGSTYDIFIAKLNSGTVTAIEDPNYQSAIQIFPNPSSGIFLIELSGKHQQISLEIYNAIGEKILQQQNTNEIDLSNSPKGIYFVKISDGTNSYTKKIIVQ